MKKHLLIMALLMALLGLLAVSCGGDEEPAIPHSDIVCFGNSLTSGMSAITEGVDDPDHAYPAYLKDKLIDSVTVYNAGVSGSMTGFDIPIGPIPSGVSRVGDVLDRTPYCVVVELGANDLLLPFKYAVLFEKIPFYNPPLTIDDITTKVIPNTKENLTVILDKLREIKKVYLVKFYTDGTGGTPDVVSGIFAYLGLDTGQKTDIVSAYDKMFAALASDSDYDNVQLISDIWSGVWDGDDTMSEDGIHPNWRGYQKQADLYFEAMYDYLYGEGWVKQEYIKSE